MDKEEMECIIKEFSRGAEVAYKALVWMGDERLWIAVLFIAIVLKLLGG